jgi:hypothetical protein
VTVVDWLLDSAPSIRWQVPLDHLAEGRPSRWNTLRALRVPRWYERA